MSAVSCLFTWKTQTVFFSFSYPVSLTTDDNHTQLAGGNTAVLTSERKLGEEVAEILLANMQK